MKQSTGIIMIGLAVFFLSLGWTGRIRDVWDALRGAVGGSDNPGSSDGSTDDPEGKKNNPEPGDDTTNKGAKCRSGDWLVTVESSGKQLCYTVADVYTMEDTGECREGWEPGTYKSFNVCVRLRMGKRPNAPGQSDPGNGIPIPGAGGAAQMNISLLPTGFTAYRYAPNV